MTSASPLWDQLEATVVSSWQGLAYAALGLVAMIVVAVRLKDASRSSRRSTLAVLALLLAEIWVVLAAAQACGVGWEIVTALLPLALVVYHAGNLWLEKPEFKDGTSKVGAGSIAKDGPAAEHRKPVEDSINRHYGMEVITARYVLPAVLIPIVGLVEFDVVNRPDLMGIRWIEFAEMPFRYGLIGAYFFVYLELGKRSVRNDITPVSIVWCVITLAAGPALAAVIPALFTGPTQEPWGVRALWIFAGYSPRLVFRTLAQAIAKSLRADTSAIQENRQVPLGRIQGIGPEEAERLAEEAIKDVHAMACVDPVRLMRDTRFDNWRIVSWVDQALLLTWVPEGIWRALVKRGYQGATDTKSLALPSEDAAAQGKIDREEAKVVLAKIAEEAGAGDPNVVRDMLVRLVRDPRISYLGDLMFAIVVQGGQQADSAQPSATPAPMFTAPNLKAPQAPAPEPSVVAPPPVAAPPVPAPPVVAPTVAAAAVRPLAAADVPRVLASEHAARELRAEALEVLEGGPVERADP
jgi:hypothetical protein